MKRVGVDIGGTFTDLVLWDDEAPSITVHKVPTSTEDPSLAAAQGLRELCDMADAPPREITFLVHGTTVATNIIIEHAGADVGLITTAGFRDIVHIGRKARDYNFSNYQDVARQSRPIVRRRHRMPVRERIQGPDGTVCEPLDETAVRDAAIALRDAGVNSVAVCFLFSFLNPAHEMRARAIVAEAFPEAYLSTSHEVVPLYREYERFSTTCLNAYVGPKVVRYLDGFATKLGDLGIKSDLHLMTSAGGIITDRTAREKPVSLLLSGPVGAVISGAELGRQTGQPSVITLDVGGTSADIGVVPNGELRMKHLTDTRIGDYDAMVPMVDIETIGAGGGSIAHVDAGGMFYVGPQSAGANPGPACYGLGGEKATVTDALVTLGWFRPEVFATAGLAISTARARTAIQTQVAEPLSISLIDAALGIYRIVVHNMVDAIRVNSVSKGYDPRDFALVPLGGAGSAFAVDIARQLSIPKIVIAANPGVGAAAGLLSTDIRYSYMATLFESLAAPDLDRISAAIASLRAQAEERLRADGFGTGAIGFDVKADCRYEGQGYELAIDIGGDPHDNGWAGEAIERFHRTHEATYLRRFPDKAVHIVNLHLTGIGQVPKLASPEVAPANDSWRDAAKLTEANVDFPTEGGHISLATPFWDRRQLGAGAAIDGPAVIEQIDTTVILPPGATATVDNHGNLIVAPGESM